MKPKYAQPIQQTIYRDGWKDALNEIERRLWDRLNTSAGMESVLEQVSEVIKEAKSER